MDGLELRDGTIRGHKFEQLCSFVNVLTYRCAVE